MRIPAADLARHLGLPGEAAVELDFPTLAGYCDGGESGDERPSMPVHVGGSGDGAWYWMEPEPAGYLRQALEDAFFPRAPSGVPQDTVV